MNIQQIIHRQLIPTNKIVNNYTYIIKKTHLPPPTISKKTSDTISNITILRAQMRSKSQNQNVSKDKITHRPLNTLELYPTIPNNLVQTAKIRSIRAQRTTPVRKYKSVQKKKESITPQPSRQIIQKKQNPYKNYLQYIRAHPKQQYNPILNFDHLRRRGRRDEMTQSQKKLIHNIINLFSVLYDRQNLNVNTDKSRRTISQNCRKYLQTNDRVKIQIILSIYYPKLLHTKLRPYLIYQRQIIYYIYILNVGNLLQKLNITQIDSIRLSLKYVKECLQLLLDPILEMEEAVVSRINQTFKILKAIGQVQKKISIIQRQMRRMFIKSNKFLLSIEMAFMQLPNQQQEWHLESLCQKEMQVSWKYLQIPPTPYLPAQPKSSKAYTLVVQLDKTIIYYDQSNKTLKYRPYIDIFLNKLKQQYQIVLFTMASQKYVEIVVGQIQKVSRYFDYILCQTHLIMKDDNLVKDYSRLGRDIKKMVILDHSKPLINKYSVNWVQITPWVGDKTDKSLYKVIKVLSQLAVMGSEDVRHYLWQKNSSLQKINQIEQNEFALKEEKPQNKEKEG